MSEQIEQSYTKIFLLILLVIFHTIFMISYIVFIVNYSLFFKTSKFIEIMVIAIAVSFIIYKKCILIDIYDYIKNLDNCDLNIPDIAKDNYFRNKIKSFFGMSNDCIDYTKYRLDILENITPMYKNDNKILHKNMYNHKVQYLISNIILILILLHKYHLQQFVPIFIIWILNIYNL